MSAGFPHRLRNGYLKFRKFFKFRMAKRKLRFWALSAAGKGPPAYYDKPEPGAAQDAVRLAIRVTGGLGDFLVAARLIRDLCAASGRLRVHLFCPSEGSIGAWVFQAVPEVVALYNDSFYHHVHRKYDGALVVNQLAYYHGEEADYDRIRTLAPGLLPVLARLNKVRPDWDVFIKHHPHLDGAMAHTAVALGDTRNTLLYSMTGLKSSGDLLPLRLDDSLCGDLRAAQRPWITINNGFDANFAIGSRPATKCYPQEHWTTLVALLKKARPDLAIVQVGSRTSKPIPGVDVDLIERTSLPQVAALIQGAALHVDIEGGLVHLAASVGTRSAVLFGPTSIKYFSYPQNINLSSGFCGNCWWTKRTWMEACPRGYETARCMEQLDPQQVAAAIVRALGPSPVVQAPQPAYALSGQA